MRGHQNLADGPVSLHGLGLICFELGDGADDAMRLEPVLNFIHEHDGAFGDGRLLDGQGGKPSSA